MNLPWEFLQVPFFAGMAEREHWDGVKACVRATIGDALILLVGYWGVAMLFRRRNWLSQPSTRHLIAFIAIGVVITVAIERLALTGAWFGGWLYSDQMYVVPGLQVGLSPLLQWLILPPVVVWFARRQLGAAGPA